VSWINARRRRPAAGYAALLLGLVVVALVYGSLTSRGGVTDASAAVGTQQDIKAGKDLFGSGAAAVFFQMSTGRMPAKEVGAENERKPVTFTPRQIDDIAGYIASLGGGPPIPTAEQVDPRKGDTAVGSQLFSANCAQCHGFAGAGGALTYGKDAPALTAATPAQIYTAMLTGPEAMPVFSDGALPPQAKRDIIAYITQTRVEPNPGGFSLGRTGPITEGLVIFLGGMGFLVVISMWITARRRDPRPTGPTGTERK
jgi:ubiquinol-cytochrome c reductase cytochrome c subunit